MQQPRTTLRPRNTRRRAPKAPRPPAQPRRARHKPAARTNASVRDPTSMLGRSTPPKNSSSCCESAITTTLQLHNGDLSLSVFRKCMPGFALPEMHIPEPHVHVTARGLRCFLRRPHARSPRARGRRWRAAARPRACAGGVQTSPVAAAGSAAAAGAAAGAAGAAEARRRPSRCGVGGATRV